jgi:glyoxylase-like metal-dependent hydrolase (beta-lactamase superfamily II)
MEEVIHEILAVGPLQCNCSVIGDEISRQALVIDPGDDVGEIRAILARHGLQVIAIVITHAHIDHIGGAARLKAATNAPVYMHLADQPLYDRLDIQAGWLGIATPEKTVIDVPLREGDALACGQHSFQVLHTPGHTPGGICLLEPAAQLLAAGDTLFRDSVGRTDLPGGDHDALFASLHGKLLTLDDEIRVVPGHGPVTTIGREREFNPFLQR